MSGVPLYRPAVSDRVKNVHNFIEFAPPRSQRQMQWCRAPWWVVLGVFFYIFMSEVPLFRGTSPRRITPLIGPYSRRS